jgi:hypothetical protein
MTLQDLLEKLDDNLNVCVFDCNDFLVSKYDGRNSINENLLDFGVDLISVDEGTVMVYLSGDATYDYSLDIEY